ncbi:hypothetical protein SAMN05421770_10627 [Granulicella rosea]|uniref:Uncharacterized protein n=1 Tax=Granulicella rosea TaxID=474952 RepID=A0A239L350_9BACT|nr:hypothetical protein [Granulicella rosea]SNT24109.1 hypothetical protein SAMN05421770_10627 [Granulicella rosea]
MNIRPVKPMSPELASEVEQILRDGVTDSSLQAMRHLGLNKIDCIKALRDLKQIPVSEGKELVDLSPAWADRREFDEAFHTMVEKVAREEFQDHDASLPRVHVA